MGQTAPESLFSLTFFDRLSGSVYQLSAHNSMKPTPKNRGAYFSLRTRRAPPREP
jgi:hypothetical protein